MPTSFILYLCVDVYVGGEILKESEDLEVDRCVLDLYKGGDK